MKLTHEYGGYLIISCCGTQTGKTQPTVHPLPTPPAAPGQYKGEYQFEAEYFEYKNISGIVKNGCSADIRNYTSQGYMHFGAASDACARTSFSCSSKRSFAIGIKYMAQTGDYAGTQLLVNGKNVGTPSFMKTAEGDWNICYLFAELNAGINKIELKATEQNVGELLLDHIVLLPLN